MKQNEDMVGLVMDGEMREQVGKKRELCNIFEKTYFDFWGFAFWDY